MKIENGTRVRHTPSGLEGVVVRQARGKLPSVMVHYNGEPEPRVAYCSQLEKLDATDS